MPMPHQFRQLPIEERHQQRRDMRAIDIGVRHDDHPAIPQSVAVEPVPHPTSQRLDQVLQLLVLPQLVGRGAGDVQDLAAQWQHRLRLPIARLLGRPAGAVAFHQEDLGLGGVLARAVGQLARQAQLARRRLAGGVLALLAPQPLLGPVDHEGQQIVRLRRVAGEEMVEPVAQRGLDQPRRIRAGQLFLGLALELRIADEDRQLGGHRRQQVLGRHLRRLAVAPVLAPCPQPLQQRGAEPRFMRAALRRRHRVAVGVQEPLPVLQPRNRPFRLAGRLARQCRLAGPDLGQHLPGRADVFHQAVAQAAGEMQHRLGRDVGPLQQCGIALPADLNAAEQIGLGAAQAVQPHRAERQRAEDRRIRLEPDGGAAPVMHRPGIDQLRGRFALGIALLPQHAVAGDFDLHLFRQGVDDRTSHTVQTAGGRVDLSGKLPTRMQRRKNNLQRTHILEFRVRIDRDAATIIPHNQKVAGL